MLPINNQRSDSFWTNPWDAINREVISQALGQHNPQVQQSNLIGMYPVDVHENDTSIVVQAELPGFTKDQIQVALEKGVLSIQAQRKLETNKGQVHLNERRYARVMRSFSLPSVVDANKVDAKLADGVLYLTLHKRDVVKPKRIEVK